MKKLKQIVCITAAIALSFTVISCTPGERGAVAGGASGAALGAVIAGSGHRATGALIGGAVGAVAGSEMSKNRAYRNRHHHRHIY
ncbi:MAG: glycine zipper 2TM domain-containing protein [Verrucomicrobiales bacterium]|nr:glycine zipper 2TM domain-containing protein [Verrucomicrobiales bacterium]